MPDLTKQLADVDFLAQRHAISPKARMLLRQDLFANNDRDEKVVTTLLHNARDTLADNWSGFMKDLKSGTISGESQAAMSALTLVGMLGMTVAMPGLGAAAIAGETFKPGRATSDWLVEHGWHPNMAAAVGTIMDTGPQAVMTIMQTKNIIAKGLIEGAPRTSKEQAKAIGSEVQNVWNYFRSKIGYGSVTKAQTSQAIQTLRETPVEAAKPTPASQVERIHPAQDQPLPEKAGVVVEPRKALPPPSTLRETPVEAPKPTPASQVERIHPAQDQPLPEKAGVVVEPRKALPPPSTAEATGVPDRVKAMDRTSDLLHQAQQSQVAPPQSETSKTLEAAKATMGGTETREMMINKREARSAFEKVAGPTEDVSPSDYYRKRLANPELMKKAVKIEDGFEEGSVAVPVGGSRKAGSASFNTQELADKAFEQLKDQPGFPNLRKEPFGLRWGQEIPEGADWVTQGKLYGYSTKAIKEHAAGIQFIRGGAPSEDELVNRMMNISREYQKNLAEYQAHGVSRDEIDRMADEMISHGYGQANVLGIAKGESLNRPEVAAMIKTVGPIFDDLIKNRDLAMKGDHQAFLDLFGNISDLGALNPHYFGGRSVAGGALGELRTPSTATTQALEQLHQIFSAVSTMPISGVEDALRYKSRILGLLGGLQTRDQLLAMLTKMPDAEQAAANPETWRAFGTNYFVNNLLTPASVGAKAFADSGTILFRGLWEKPLAAYVTRPLNNILGNPLGLKQGDIAVPGEALQYLYGMRTGLLKGWSYLGRWDLNGLAKAAGTEEKSSQFMDMGQFLSDRFGKIHPFLGKAGEVTGDISGVASSGLQLVTNAARVVMKEAEGRALLFRRLSEQGLTGEKLGSELEQQMKYLPKDIEDAADKVAQEYSFGDRMPAFFEWLGGGINKFRLMKYEVPFFRAIVNFSRWGFNRAAPTSYASNLMDVAFHGRNADILAGGEKAATAWTNIIGSTIMGGALGLFARAGYIGGGGLGFDKNRIREMRGVDAIQPYSFFGYGVQAAHPFGQMIGEIGDLGEILNHLPATDDTFLKKTQDAFGAFLYSLARNYGEIPALEGITNLARIKEDMDRGRFEGLGMGAESQRSQAFAKARFLEGFIPAGGVLRSIAQEIEGLTADPYVKWNASIWDQLKSDFWGFGQFIPGLDKPKPLLNTIGLKQYYPDKVGPDIISRISSYDREPTPLAKELNRLGFSMTPTPHTILGVARSDDPAKQVLSMPKEGVPLTDDEWYNYDSGRKIAFGEAGRKFLENPLYQNMNDMVRLKEFNQIEKKMSEGVKGRMILQPGALHERVMDGITRKKILLMAPGEVPEETESSTPSEPRPVPPPVIEESPP